MPKESALTTATATDIAGTDFIRLLDAGNGNASVIMEVNQFLTLITTLGLLDANGDTILSFQTLADAVNNLEVRNSATGNAVTLSTVGDDTTVNLELSTKGGSGVIHSQRNLDLNNKSLINAVIAKTSGVRAFIESHAASHTLSAAECYGAVYYVTAAATLTLPAAADGMSLTVITDAAVAVSVKANTSDLISLDGTDLDDGDKITNSSTLGDAVTLTYRDSTGWYALSDGNWTDGGA